MQNTNAFARFLGKYYRYLTAVVLFAVFVIILVSCADKQDRAQVADTQLTEATEIAETVAADFELDKELKEDAVPELNELLNTYYTAYAKDDLDTLESIAYPMSDNEKSYIGVFSQYIKEYKNIKCYTKSGVTDGSYLVSAYYELQFHGVKTLAQGLDFFYVETDPDGKLYINNLYSPFNFSRTENAMDPTIYSVIIEYGEQEDVAALSKQVNEKYQAAIASDVDLAKMISTTIPDVMKNWLDTIEADNTENGEQTAKAQTEATETKEEISEKKDEKADSESAEKADSEKAEKTDEKTDSESAEKTDEKTEEKKDDTEKKSKKKKTVKVRTTTDGVFIREKPSTDSDIQERTEKGDTFTKISESDGWTKIKYKDGKAYIKSDYLEEVK